MDSISNGFSRLCTAAARFQRQDMLDHFHSIMADYRMEAEWAGEPMAPWVRTKSLWEVIRLHANAAWCELVGHDYYPDGCDYLESGGEGFECRRCHSSFTAWH